MPGGMDEWMIGWVHGGVEWVDVLVFIGVLNVY